MSKLSTTAWELGVAGIWAIALAVAFATTTPRPWVLTIIGISLGCVSGYLRSRAIQRGAASSAAKALTWLCGIGLLILAMAIAEDMFVGAWATSFAGYLLLSSMVTLPATYHKEHQGVAADGT